MAYYGNGSSNGSSNRWDSRGSDRDSDRYGSSNGGGDHRSSSRGRYGGSGGGGGGDRGGDRYGPSGGGGGGGGDRYGSGSYDRYGSSASGQDGGKYGPSGGGGGGADYGSGGGGGGGGWGDRQFDSMAGLGGSLATIQWDISRLPIFEKNFYIEHPDVSKRSEREAEEWRRSVDITVIGRGIPKPVHSFEEASMPEYVLREVLKQGFASPTPIQAQGWPMALLGRDMIGISATGSGKH